jgi:hypothetical protein
LSFILGQQLPPLFLCIAAVALAFGHFSFRAPTPVGRKRMGNAYLFLELTLTISADVTF